MHVHNETRYTLNEAAMRHKDPLLWLIRIYSELNLQRFNFNETTVRNLFELAVWNLRYDFQTVFEFCWSSSHI